MPRSIEGFLLNLKALGLSEQAVALLIAREIARRIPSAGDRVAVVVSGGFKGLVGEFLALLLGVPVIRLGYLNLPKLDISLREAGGEPELLIDASEAPIPEEMLSRAKKLAYVLSPSSRAEYDVGFVVGGASVPARKLVDVSKALPEEASIYVGPGDVKESVPERKMRSYKGENGRLLVVGGSYEYFGAPIMTALAAQRVGADVVKLVAPEPVAVAAVTTHPQLISVKAPGKHLSPDVLDVVLAEAEGADFIVAGPGAGRRDETLRFFRELVDAVRGKALLDADALRAFAGRLDALEEAVITPHAGEASYLLGERVNPRSVRSRVEAALKLSKKCRCYVLLKGFVDVMAYDGSFRLNKTHPPSMTVAGTGDVLAGVVGGLIARGADKYDAICVGALICGLAGCVAYRRFGEGMSAMDVVEGIPEALRNSLKLCEECPFYIRVPDAWEGIGLRGSIGL